MIRNDTAVALAQALEPILLFDPTERFFPVAAEELLDHRATEPWADPATHERGSAVLLAAREETSFGDADVRAGSHAPAGAHIQLSAAPPDGIGQAFAVDANHDLFLDVSGWDDATAPAGSAPRFGTGSLEYLDLLFRSIGHAMNPSLPADAPARIPQFTIPRLAGPTVYAEVDWAGIYPRIDAQRVATAGGSPDFPPAVGSDMPAADNVARELDDYVAITYYLLYPAMEPAPVVSNAGVRKREGQWEAITAFLRGHPADARDADGRPDFLTDVQVPESSMVRAPDESVLGLLPRFIVYSHGWDAAADLDSPLPGEARPLFGTGDPDLAVFGFDNHSLAYVTAGTHKNLFAIAAITHVGDSPPDPVLNPLGGAIMGAAGTLAGVCLGLSPPPLTPACIVCLVIAAVLFLIGLILFILSFFLRSDPPVDEAPNPSSTDVARDGGPASLPAGQPAPQRPGVQPVGSAVASTLRVVNRFRFDPVPPVDTYPLPAPLTVELPTWWGYTGRWGVRTVNQASAEWDSGTRRLDASGRTRAYWNTYRLFAFLNAPARATDGIGP